VVEDTIAAAGGHSLVVADGSHPLPFDAFEALWSLTGAARRYVRVVKVGVADSALRFGLLVVDFGLLAWRSAILDDIECGGHGEGELFQIADLADEKLVVCGGRARRTGRAEAKHSE
jgi:hypothetical protein